MLLLLSCTAPTTSSELDAVVAQEAATPPADVVDVTLYFRQGRGPSALLVPVVRAVPVGSELARTALELLLAGPAGDDPDGLRAVVPSTTDVRGFAIDGMTAKVDLSGHLITDAADVGSRPEHELLALAAIANTLTEFPEVSRVALTVDGQPGGPFWGGWGLPRVLLRDDSVIAPTQPADGLPDLATFSRRAQRLGEPHRRAAVTNVRLRPRATYLRVTVELSGADGSALHGAPPAAMARRRGDDVHLSIAASAPRDLNGDQPLDDPAFAAARIDVREAPRSLSITLRPVKPADFALRALTDPARVVLDIRR